MPIDRVPCEGPEDALVTVVEYMGYECPFSRRLESTLQRLIADHPGDIRFCVRQLVIERDQPHGLLAAYAALETYRQLGSEAFFSIHREYLRTELDDARIVDLALSMGVDEAQLREAFATRRYTEMLQRDQVDLNRLNRTGTPNIFIAGRSLSGARDYEVYEPVLLRALDEARRLVSAGVPAEDLYSALQRTAETHVVPPQPRPGEPRHVRIRNIHVATSLHPLSTEERTLDEARALAESVRAQLLEGADFAELARRWSSASNAGRGGEFGWMTRSTLTEDTWDFVIRMEVNEVAVHCEPKGRACIVIHRQE